MGIWINKSPVSSSQHNAQDEQQNVSAYFENLGLADYINVSNATNEGKQYCRAKLRDELASKWSPDHDTTRLALTLNLDTLHNTEDLEREILLAMLLSPDPFRFPSYDEFISAVRVRKYMVLAARKTTLDFHTTEAERPEDYWTYHEDTSFTILPGKSLITALQKATQPEASGKLYSFSCYRATEYVILLGLAQELYHCNPDLYEKLQAQWERKAIKSGKFHEIFMIEYGSMAKPLPPKYYVPGDRLWFRNPDKDSSEITGYEGSWVFYLGSGLFTNFWKANTPYTLTSKCVEIYHWRHATSRDQAGELQMNENIVEELVNNTIKDPVKVDLILQEMMKYRVPLGTFENGGCIDTTREYPRYVCPGTSDIVLPNN